MTHTRTRINLVTWLLLAIVVPYLAALALTQAMAAGVRTLEQPAAGVHLELTDVGDEQWWTTTDCPDGVQVPCLDPEAHGAPGLPAEVDDVLESLVAAQWVCLDRVGELMPDGTVRVSHAQLQVCRGEAYAAVPEAG